MRPCLWSRHCVSCAGRWAGAAGGTRRPGKRGRKTGDRPGSRNGARVPASASPLLPDGQDCLQAGPPCGSLQKRPSEGSRLLRQEVSERGRHKRGDRRGRVAPVPLPPTHSPFHLLPNHSLPPSLLGLLLPSVNTDCAGVKEGRGGACTPPPPPPLAQQAHKRGVALPPPTSHAFTHILTIKKKCCVC